MIIRWQAPLPGPLRLVKGGRNDLRLSPDGAERIRRPFRTHELVWPYLQPLRSWLMSEVASRPVPGMTGDEGENEIQDPFRQQVSF